MNIELYSYSVMASILGIIIVFVSLLGLSLLMVLLKVMFQDKVKPEAPVKISSKPAATPAGAGSEAQEGQDWIMAAVVAFLMEEDVPPPSAAAWGPRNSEGLDPWMNRAAFDRNPV